MSKLILVNGPPRSGKDTAGGLIREITNGDARVDKFARVLKEMCHAAYGQVFADGTVCPHDFFENCKDQPHPEFHGATPRQVYIAMSERMMKPLHGPGIFGKMLLEKHLWMCGTNGAILVVTDSGFREEAEVLVERFGAANTTIVQLEREGCTFENDSRDYVYLAHLRVEVARIANNGTIDQLRERLRSALAGRLS